jgi:RimJ/RimL family protein N-acetyltransferase
MPVPISPRIAGRLSDEERALPNDEHGCYCKYDITFVELREEHLELLRHWRNHPDITRFMVFRDQITPEMQAQWFRELEPLREVYTIIYFRGEAVGMTQLRHMDYEGHTAEGGIIIFRPEHQNGLIPYRAAIAGMDSDFLHRGMETLYATVTKTNPRAQRFARSLGYAFSDPDPNGEILRGQVTVEDYFHVAKKWRAVLNQDAARGYGMSAR